MERTESEKLFYSLVPGSDWSTLQEDMHKHFDIVTPDYKVDVKGMKRVNGSDPAVNPDIHWVEFKNVNGKVGWVGGEADYIAFEQPDHFIMVDRKTLAKNSLDIMKGKTEVFSANTKKELHTWYSRPGKLDIIVLLHISEINSLKEFIIKK